MRNWGWNDRVGHLAGGAGRGRFDGATGEDTIVAKIAFRLSSVKNKPQNRGAHKCEHWHHVPKLNLEMIGEGHEHESQDREAEDVSQGA